MRKLLLVIILFLSAGASADDPGVTMLFMSDPQYPWYTPLDCGDECVRANSGAAIRRMTSAMDNVQQLGNWPSSMQFGGGAPMGRPAGVIVNGDLTAYFHKWQKEFYYALVHLRPGTFGILKDAPFPVYAGLGNHDYKNNVSDCYGGYELFPLDDDRCAKEAAWFMSELIGGLPGVVNQDVSGFARVANDGGYVARFSVSYDDGGSRHTQSTDVFEVLQSREILIPKSARNVHVVIERNTGLIWQGDNGWVPIQSYSYARPPAACWSIAGTTLDPTISREGCGTHPNGSNGSLSYSFEIGGYHFVQLQYRPDYSVSLAHDEGALGVGYSPGFNVTTAYDWLRADLAAATAAGKLIVLNMHDPVAVDCGARCSSPTGRVYDDPAFRSAIAGQNVVAIFGGHLHERFGRFMSINNGVFDIPIIHSASADCERFLVADFHNHYFNVAAVDSTSGSPAFIFTPNAQCRSGMGVGNGSNTEPRTYIVNRRPTVTGSITTATPREGFDVQFKAVGSDGDGDTLTYSWTFGDGATATGATPSHEYADDGTYSVRVTVNDGYGGTASSQFNVTVANVAPELGIQGERDLDEGDTAVLTLDIHDRGIRDAFTLTVDWKDGTQQTFSLPAGTTAYTVSHLYRDNVPAEYPVSLQLSDGDGGITTKPHEIRVRNVEPRIQVASVTIDEGQTATLNVAITDPGVLDTFTLVVEWGEGAPETIPLAAGNKSKAIQHLYKDDALSANPSDRYSVRVRITDKDGGRHEGNPSVTVRNVNPTATASPITIDETQTATIQVTISDPGVLDTFRLTIDWKDGTTQTVTPPAGVSSYSHAYVDDDPTGTPSDLYAVALAVVDKDTGSGAGTAAVTVRNINPVATIATLTDEAGQLLGGNDPLLVGLSVTSRETYADAGPRDTRTAIRSWGDGSPTEVLGPVLTTTSGVHTFTRTGTFALTVTVTDDDTGIGIGSRNVRVATPADVVKEVVEDLKTVASSNADAMRAIQRAIAALIGNIDGDAKNGALDKLLQGNASAALVKIEEAIEQLQIAEAADPALEFTRIKSRLTLVAKSVAVDAVTKAAAEAKTAGQLKKVEDAKKSIAQGQTALGAQRYIEAVRTFRGAL